jgi:V8-like Glu-specific endopeptidase
MLRTTGCLFGILFALSIGVQGCAPVDGDSVGAQVQPVIGGSATTGVLNVVAVLRTGGGGSGGGLCTGAVISRHAVLTAKHCVYDEVADGVWEAIDPNRFVVAVGHDVGSASGISETVGVREIRSTSGVDVDRDLNQGDDVAVLLLNGRIGVGRRYLASSAARNGEGVTMVGFGRILAGTSEAAMDSAGVKYQGSASVRRVRTGTIETTGASSICQGDSGGPLFRASDGDILGVSSFGRTRGCTESNSYFSRVDRHLSWINPLLAWEPPCTPTDEVCGDGVDNDCDGTADEDCTLLGDPCSRSDECADGSCQDVDGTRLCVRACDPRESIPFCPLGFHCDTTGCSVGRCIAGTEGPGAEGVECSRDLDCASAHCASIDGVQRCGRPCDSEINSCQSAQVCEETDEGCGACLPVEYSDSPRPFGFDCNEDAECESGLCPDGFCTEACSAPDGCPRGHHCRAMQCVRGDLGRVGDECFTAEDCGMSAPACVNVDGDLLCAPSCEGEEACPEGFECADTEMGLHCVPPGLPLGASCTSPEECRTGLCAGMGTCTRFCDEEDCPDGFSCLPAGGASGCFPTPVDAGSSSGGCSVAHNSAREPGLAGLLLLGVMLLGWRRRFH